MKIVDNPGIKIAEKIWLAINKWLYIQFGKHEHIFTEYVEVDYMQGQKITNDKLIVKERHCQVCNDMRQWDARPRK